MNILKKNPHAQVFLMNTGYIGGEKGEKVSIYHSTEIIKQIALDGIITWEKDPVWGYEVPTKIGDMDITRLIPCWHYSRIDYLKLTNKLKEERIQWLSKFPELDPAVMNSLNLKLDEIPE